MSPVNTYNEHDESESSLKASKIASTIGDPYPEVNEDVSENSTKELGRLAVVLANEKQYREDYNGPDNKKCAARVGEIAVDDDGNLGVFLKNGNTVGSKLTFFSQTKELNSIISKLEDMGILANARSFAANSNINNLMFDNSKKIVNLNPNRLYRSAIKYYAIRSNEKNDANEYEWMTGIIGKDTYGEDALLTPLIDMNRVNRLINGESVTLSEPMTGSLIRDMTDGEAYTVLFYDSDRRLIGQDQYDAISVSSQGGLVAPNTAITGLVVESSRIGPEENSTYLYVGESAANLALRVFVQYADGKTMEVTSESFGNGRLVIEGLDSISTEYPTEDGKSPFELNIKYYLLDDNSESSKNGKQATSINTTYKVFVKEDIYDVLMKITPAGVVNGEYNLPTTKVKLKIYGQYQSGAVRDITPTTKSGDRLIGYDNASYNSVNDTWDANNTVINTGTHEIIVKIPQGRGGIIKQFIFNYETSTAHRRFIINGANSKFVTFNAYTGTMSFEENVSSSSLSSENQFINTDNSIITPTHFSIKSAMNSAVLYADKIPLDNIRGFKFNTATGTQPYTDMPLIIEFSRLVEASDGVTSSVFVTNAALYYAKQQN